MTDIDENQDTILVAEYTLGLMTPEAEKAFAERLIDDTALRLEYVRWTEHFAKLSNEIEEVTPPATLKADVLDRLFGEPTQEKSKTGWLNLGWLSGLALACLVSVLVFISMPDNFTPIYTAQLNSEDQRLQVTALYDPKAKVLRIDSLKGTPSPGRDFELWAIIGDKPPVSLGVMTALKREDLTISNELVQSLTGATLALSDEPQGGSPTGSPTGDVLVVGKIQAI